MAARTRHASTTCGRNVASFKPRLRAVEAEERELDAHEERAEVVSERIIDDLVDEAIRTGLARRID